MNILYLIEALESGLYTQTKSRLKSHTHGGCFCVMGVACEVFRQRTGIGEWEDTTFVIDNGQERYTGTGTPPNQVMDWFNIVEPFKWMDLNDYDNQSFIEIAARMRKEFNVPS